MLIQEEEVLKRLNNPLNLMNRMRGGLSAPKKEAMDLFTRSKEVIILESIPEGVSETTAVSVIPFSNPFPKPPTPTKTPFEVDVKTEDLIDDSDSKIKLALAHDTALGLLTNGLSRLAKGVESGQIEDKKIPHILATTSKIITDIRKERLEREKNNKGDRNIHYHFYCPEQRKLETYEVIDVHG